MAFFLLFPLPGKLVFRVCDELVQPTGYIEGRHIREKQRQAFLGGTIHRFGGGFAPGNEGNSGMLLEGGDGDDILVGLSGDPQVALGAVGHHIAEQISRITALDLSFQFLFPGKDLQMQRRDNCL